jgi:hypothetical protein
MKKIPCDVRWSNDTSLKRTLPPYFFYSTAWCSFLWWSHFRDILLEVSSHCRDSEHAHILEGSECPFHPILFQGLKLRALSLLMHSPTEGEVWNTASYTRPFRGNRTCQANAFLLWESEVAMVVGVYTRSPRTSFLPAHTPVTPCNPSPVRNGRTIDKSSTPWDQNVCIFQLGPWALPLCQLTMGNSRCNH